MTDKKFQLLLDRLAIANVRYKEYLQEAEDEIKRRYGKFPSDIDNDQWIDSYHTGQGRMTVQEVDESMKICL